MSATGTAYRWVVLMVDKMVVLWDDWMESPWAVVMGRSWADAKADSQAARRDATMESI